MLWLSSLFRKLYCIKKTVMKKFCVIHVFIALFLLVFVRSNAQEKSIEELLAGLDDYVENALKDWQIPGVAIGL